MNKNKKNYSKKNYIEIAKIISKSEYITDLIYNLANYFEQDNKAFNKNKFVNACINTPEEKKEGSYGLDL